MPAAKLLTRNDILRAMKMTKSNLAASRYLNITLGTYKKYSKMYFDKESEKSLYELHKNQTGKGVLKFRGGGAKDADLDKLLSGELFVPNYPVEKFKTRLIQNSILADECNKCGFHEVRVFDYKVPVILNFIDSNKKNWRKENLELLCYNCYYLHIGDIFTKKQIEITEDHISTKSTEKVWDMEMDDNMREHFISLGLIKENEDEVKPGEEFRDYKEY